MACKAMSDLSSLAPGSLDRVARVQKEHANGEHISHLYWRQCEQASFENFKGTHPNMRMGSTSPTCTDDGENFGRSSCRHALRHLDRLGQF